MSKVKYCAVVASGIVLVMLGITVGLRSASTGGLKTASGLKSTALGITLVLGGLRLKIWGLTELHTIYASEEFERLFQRSPDIPKPCQGCCNYHGKEYGGVMLVCGIHPEGVKGDSCPDYEVFKGGKGGQV
ncbi:hypothetical protein [Anabaena azotica]|uniref:Uncharacterized protein n=1 Tax=Anabaena azotica FACHB-119 TaxID=947527 RepID=A0ABR8DES1_9NOST|nr:hypothetical protein [Anabaena azotica]MBD2504697.1 hypothetical protein [Anabaena azotica FACHB-119]